MEKISRYIQILIFSEFNEFNHVLAIQKLIELARRIDEVNSKQKEEDGITGSDVF